MNKTVTVVLLMSMITLLGFSQLTSILASTATSEDNWNTKASLPTATFLLGAATVDGKIYVIGGFNQTYGTQNTNLMYYPETDTWTKMAPMPTPRAWFGIAVYQNKIYVFGGVTQAHVIPWGVGGTSIDKWTAATEVYDPATDTWETKQSMPSSKFAFQANQVGEKIYITYVPKWLALNLTEIYDPLTDSWSTTTPMPNTQDKRLASAVVGNKIYYISDQTQIFNTETEQWTMRSPPPYPVYQGAAATITNNTTTQIYLFGENLTQIYNLTTDTWTTGAAMPTSRVNLAAATLDDTIYLIGGTSNITSTGTALATNEQYIPAGYSPTQPTTTPTDTTQKEPTPLNIPTIIIASAATIATVAICAVIYFKKRHRGS